MKTADQSAPEAIAIIGMSGRFPGASNSDALWKAIVEKRDCLADYPGGRSLELEAFYAQAGMANRPPSRRGGFLPDADKFDAAFFEISPREAEWTDPQQRLLLEVAWDAFEDAGQPREGLAGSKVGVFIGVWVGDYAVDANRNAPAADFFHVTGGPLYGVSSRIAYQFDLRGPDISVNAACASSLVAVHLASRSLRTGECSLALAGGVNLIFRHEETQAFAAAGMLSKDGCCKFGDARADGFVRSEGVGLLVLKRLADARRDQDRILGLIRGSAVVNGGRLAGSMSTPSAEGQRQAMLDAVADAQVDPASIQYVEAHGTGTLAGDPVELAAIASVFGKPSGRSSLCRVGSVKSNIGHTESAAGVAGILKTLHALEHRLIPPTIHVEQPNPAVDWAGLGIALECQGAFWEAVDGTPRRASVNGLGLTGTNAHVVLEEAPAAIAVETPTRAVSLLPISAASEPALRQRARDMAARLEEMEAHPGPQQGIGEGIGLGDLCYTAAVRRSHLTHRLAVAGVSARELKQRLEAYAGGREAPFVTVGVAERGRVPKVAFVFPGQGSQWIGMGRELLKTEPAFRHALEACGREIQKEAGWSLLEQIENSAIENSAGEERQDERLARIDVIQPTLFAVEVALAELWKTWGVVPAAVVGHSMGEVAAARIAGILSLPDAVKVICRRSALLMRVAGSGAMVAVDLPRAQAEEAIAGFQDRIKDRISVAVSNSPRSTVLAGDPKALDAVVERLEEQEVFCRWVRVDVASHSPRMEPLKADLSAALGEIQPRAGAVPLCSTVQAATIGGEQMDAAYWVSNLRETVQFAAAIDVLLEQGFDTFIEMSPHPILVPFVEQTAEQAAKQVLALGSLRREESETATLLLALGKLYASGQAVDWRRMYPAGKQIALPAYPWQRERFWIEPSVARRSFASAAGHPLIGQPLIGQPLIGQPLRVGTGEWIWTTKLTAEAHPWLKDHGVHGSLLLPASAYAQFAQAVAQAVFAEHAVDSGRGASASGRGADASGQGAAPGVLVERLHLDRAAALAFDNTVDLQVVAAEESEGSFRLDFFSRRDESSEWTRAAQAMLRRPPPQPAGEAASLSAWEEAEFSPQAISGRSHAEWLAQFGYEYGPSFRRIEWISLSPESGLAAIRIPPGSHSESYQLHPATLDAALQLLLRLLLQKTGAAQTLLPVEFDSLQFAPAGNSGELLYARATLSPTTIKASALKGDVDVYDGAGKLRVKIRGLAFKPLAGGSAAGLDSLLYRLVWEKMPESAANAAPTAAGSWLLIADEHGAAAGLADALKLAGASVQIASSVASSAEVLDGREPPPKSLRGVVLLTPLDLASGSTLAQAEKVHADAAGLVRRLTDAREAAESPGLAPDKQRWDTRLWVVTRGAQSAPQPADAEPIADPLTCPLAAGLWGLAASVGNEHPELHASCIDLASEPDAREFARLAGELIAGQREDRVALRARGRYVARLMRWEAGASTAPVIPAGNLNAGSLKNAGSLNAAKSFDAAKSFNAVKSFELVQRIPGSLKSFELRSVLHPEPGAGELEIAVEAGGLNFLDVLRAMGSDEALAGSRFGGECAGTVLRVGPGVPGFAAGDPVIALSPSFQEASLFRSRVTVPAELVVKQPGEISFSQAAGLPCVWLTAYYSLVVLARLKQGEKVLIHAAAGGVGLAAIQIARWIGAEIYATAGSQEKRAYLASLGVQHIMSSRTLDFERQVREKTGGEGVDVVLNSLAGPAIEAGLKSLAPYGRFVEIGKRDIWHNSKIGLEPFQRNLSLFAVDLAKLVEDRRGMVGGIFREVMDRFGQGVFTPLPVTVFPISEAGEAFRTMAQAKHMGKLVLSMRDPAARVRLDCSQVSAQASYLITGGLGGLGLAAAEALVARGARHLVLVSRRPASSQAQVILAGLSRQGVGIAVRSLDVASAPEVDALFAEIAATLPPLRGIVHAAGVLDDAVARHLSQENFQTVMAGKVAGALALNRHVRPGELDFLVYYSSAAAVLGTPGQGNYAAANAMLDALAHAQRARGIPAIAIDWGTWADVGLAAAGQNRGERLASHGLRQLAPAEGKQLLIHILREAPVQAAAMRLDAAQWCASYPAAERSGIFAALLPNPDDATGAGTAVAAAGGVDFAGRYRRLPAEQARQALAEWLGQQVAAVLRCAVEQVLPEKPLRSLGLDSLMALELRNRLERGLRLKLSATLAWNYPTVAVLAAHLEAKIAENISPGRRAKPVSPESGQAPGNSGDFAGPSAADLLQAELLGAQSLLSK